MRGVFGNLLWEASVVTFNSLMMGEWAYVRNSRKPINSFPDLLVYWLAPRNLKFFILPESLKELKGIRRGKVGPVNSKMFIRRTHIYFFERKSWDLSRLLRWYTIRKINTAAVGEFKLTTVLINLLLAIVE